MNADDRRATETEVASWLEASAPALETAPTIKWLGDDAGVVATQWFAHLAERFKQSSIDQFASVRRTEAFCEKWAAESASLESRGRSRAPGSRSIPSG